MRTRAAALGTLSLLALSACGEGPVGPGPVEEITELPRALTAGEIEMIGASNRFAFDLLRDLVPEGVGPDIVLDLIP
jgi:hypothetical protein